MPSRTLVHNNGNVNVSGNQSFEATERLPLVGKGS